MHLSQGGLVWSDQEFMAAVDPEDLLLQFGAFFLFFSLYR